MGRRGYLLGALMVTISAVAALPAPARPRHQLPYVERSRTVPVPIVANGVRLSTPALMLRAAGRTVLPMRALFTSLGAQVVWNAQERAVYAWKTDGTGVRFGVGEAEAQAMIMPGPNERATVTERRALSAPATLVGSRLYIPIRAAGELLGADVNWDEAQRTVYIGARPETTVGQAEP